MYEHEKKEKAEQQKAIAQRIKNVRTNNPKVSSSLGISEKQQNDRDLMEQYFRIIERERNLDLSPTKAKNTISNINRSQRADDLRLGLVYSEGRIYNPTDKHRKGGWGTEMDLNDSAAQEVLANSIQGGKQLYGYKDGKLYEFQPDNIGGWHGYPVKGTEVPPSVLRKLKSKGEISNVEYNKMVKGK